MRCFADTKTLKKAILLKGKPNKKVKGGGGGKGEDKDGRKGGGGKRVDRGGGKEGDGRGG